MRNLSYYMRKTAAVVLVAGMLSMTGCTDNTDKGQDSNGQFRNETVQAKAEDSKTKTADNLTTAQNEDKGASGKNTGKETQAATEKAVKETAEETTQAEELTKEEETTAIQEETTENVEETTKAPVDVKPVYRVNTEPSTQMETTTAAQTEAVIQVPVQTTEAQTEKASSGTSGSLTAPFGIAFLGDSITVGYKSSYSYADVVCEDLGCVQFNYGISGNTLASNGGEGFVERYKCINPDCKVIVVYGGSNDYYDNVELGSPDSTKKDEFYGGLKKLCAGLKESYPDAYIVFLTPLPGEFGGMHNSSNNETGSSMWDYVDAMQKTCAKYDIPVIDLYHNFTINADNYDSYTSDGLHPNEDGHSEIAKAVEKYIKSLM